MPLAFCAQGKAQQFLPAAIDQPQSQLAALAEQLGSQLLATNQKRPFILDLTLPNDARCPMGAWLADRISESLAQSHPELQVIPRSLWNSARTPSEPAHDQNQEFARNQERARSIGAQVLVHGNFAAVSSGIGITLTAMDKLSGGDSRFEVLAEIPITPEMQSVITTPLPLRADLHGTFTAGLAGISSPVCEDCPAPEYTYMAKVRKLQGIVIAEVWVGKDGTAENVKIIRAPDPALGNAALRAVRNWRFKPARNFLGEFVPAVVNVATSFRLDRTNALSAQR
jgi:TonB family protein